MSAAFQLYVHEMIGDGTTGEADFVDLSKGQLDPFATGIVAAFTSVAGLAVGDWPRLERAAERGLALDPEARFTFWGSSLVMAQAIARLNLGHHDDDTIDQFDDGDGSLRRVGREHLTAELPRQLRVRS